MVGRIQSDLSGREALNVIDQATARIRSALSEAMRAVDSLDTRRAEIADQRVALLRELAAIRLDLIESGDGTKSLDSAHKRAKDLLKSQEKFVAEQEALLEKTQLRIEELEAQRVKAADARDSAVAAYEDLVASVEARLKGDAEYKALVQAVSEASAVSARAEQKLDLAKTDREEKGEPYEDDPLFSYLWKRRYRTPEYKAGAFFRFLDGWVARLCSYDKHWTNYQRLTELPERLAEHVEAVEKLEQAAIERLEEAERAALEAAGEGKLKAKIEVTRQKVVEIDRAIELAENAHVEAVKNHDLAVAERTGPVIEARELIALALNKASFPELRVLAAETVSLDDDRIVDRLVKLRTEELALEQNESELQRLPAQRRYELDRLEGFRRDFKVSGLDSPYILLAGAALAQLVDALIAGRSESSEAVRRLRKTARRKRQDRDDDWSFGGRSRSATSGLPGIVTDVLIEVAKQAGRSRGVDFKGGPWGGSSPGRRTSFPRPRSTGRSKKRGGFRTGGGF